MRKLGEVLADMIRYGDINEAPWPDEWLFLLEESGLDYQTLSSDDPELFIRLNVVATFLRLAGGGQGGSCSVYDRFVAPFLAQEIEVPLAPFGIEEKGPTT